MCAATQIRRHRMVAEGPPVVGQGVHQSSSTEFGPESRSTKLDPKLTDSELTEQRRIHVCVLHLGSGAFPKARSVPVFVVAWVPAGQISEYWPAFAHL